MDKLEIIKKEATDLASKLIETFTLDVALTEEMYLIHIVCDADAPTIIGRHGETIRAFQKILEVAFYKQFGEQVNILVDVNDYRTKQKEKIQEITDRYVQKATETHERAYVRGFSAFERKIAHEHIVANYPELTSYSEGEGRDRRLYIESKNNSSDSSSE